jgi:molybdopterin-biosynthesis enzyme MoeA-like protein
VEARALRAAHDIVFTSGGVGPTHDDVTLIAVAKAFGRALTRAEAIERLIRDFHGARTTDDHLRMADVPTGARLLASEQVRWPTVVVDNVYVFPGVPEIFRMKFPIVRDELAQGARFHSRAVFTRCDEGSIASALAGVATRYPDTFVGSYPRFRDPVYSLKLTVDGADEHMVGRAMDEILAFLPADKIVRTE